MKGTISNPKNYLKACPRFAQVSGFMIINTESGETLIRPIGGVFGNGVNDAMNEAESLYPGAEIRVITESL